MNQEPKCKHIVISPAVYAEIKQVAKMNHRTLKAEVELALLERACGQRGELKEVDEPKGNQ